MMFRMDRGSVYGPSMVPLVAPVDFSKKLVFGLFWIQGVTMYMHGKRLMVIHETNRR